MLKVIGSVYGNSIEGLEEIKAALEKGGFEVAYVTESQGTIIKEVESLHESEDKES